MMKWIHHLLNPHCEHCADEKRESRACNSCDILTRENERLRFENDKLLNHLLHPSEQVEVKQSPEEYKSLVKHLSWQARRQLLETESKEAAKVLRAREKELATSVTTPGINKSITEELEKDLGIEDAS